MHIAGKHCTNGMNSVVAVEALKTKASEGGDDRGLLKSELVFYDGMDDGVALSTPPRGGRFGIHGGTIKQSLFQSTPPRGGRFPSSMMGISSTRFQSTPPRGGRYGSPQAFSARSSFNPRPRAGGDHTVDLHAYGGVVSIHAPARGAMRYRPGHSAFRVVSIHAPARGAMRYSTKNSISNKFQSTPPRGGRYLGQLLLGHVQVVSIHAPARGAISPPRRWSRST